MKAKIIVALITALASLIPTMTKIYLDHRTIKGLRNQIVGLHGSFEWQWAGEGWKGIVQVASNQNGRRIATVDLKKWCNNQSIGDAIESTSDGEVDAYENGFTLHLPVEKYFYDQNCKLQGAARYTLTADVNRVEAYAGEVTYVDDKGKKTYGDMVLVAYSSGIK